MITELQAKFDGKKSFYGKAKIENLDGVLILHSYDTKVCRINLNNKEANLFNVEKYSQTTLRHIKEFLLQNNFKAENKKQILADYKELI